MKGTAAAGIAAGATTALASRRCRDDSVHGRAAAELQSLVCRLPLCRDVDQALKTIERSFVSAFDMPVAIISARPKLCVLRHTPGFEPGDEDREAAGSAIRQRRTVRVYFHAARQYRYFVPLLTADGPAGALEFATHNTLPAEFRPLIRCFAAQTSLTMVRSALADEARHASSLAEADRFQETLLNSIAHNVKTPLASIMGVLSTLQEHDAALNPAVRRDLIDTARQEAHRLNRLLGNLLDFSRIESRAVQVRADLCDVQDVIGAALEQLGSIARERTIHVELDPYLPLVRMDFALIVQVLVNLLDNALKYSGAEKPIHIAAHQAGNTLEIRVEDQGDGIAEKDLAHVFEKFNRAGRTGETGGIGLGLSICKGLIAAHRGSIWAERRTPNGAAVAFRLPLNSGG